MKQRSVMEHSFSRVPKASIPRSSFDRSHGLKTTFDADDLTVMFVDSVLPGDTFNLEMTGFARLATPIFPIMDNLFMDTFFFFVPYRLVWENWEKFCGAQDDPGDSISFTIPLISAHIPAVMSLSDQMGLPTRAVLVDTASALPFRAYNLIYNDWFRDQNLQDSVTVNVNNGPDAIGLFATKRRGKRHDYFTSCLPWPQKGSSIALPLGVSAPVTTDGAEDAAIGVHSSVQADNVALDTDGSAGGFVVLTSQGGATPDAGLLYADLATATSATINEIRQAFQIQKLVERDARGGTRYVEVIKSHFGVTSPDARLQRPEYLGGGSSPVNISPIAQTSETLVGTPQANLAAIGTVALHNHGFTKSFTEHGVILGIVTVRGDLTYQQGINRDWSRQTRYDFYWPALALIGEQAVLNREIYYQDDANDILVFGYQERFAEYRYKPSEIHGLFRSDAAGSLDAWHVSQDFSALPLLNDSFIQNQVPIDRVIAVPSEPHFLFDAYFKLRCARPMPMFGVPGLIDHF